MRSERLICVLVVLMMFGGLCASQPAVQEPFRIAGSSAQRIEVELSVPTLHMERAEYGGKQYSRISIDGAASTADAGAPELPLFSTLLAIPVNAEYTVSYELSGIRSIPDVTPYPVIKDEGATQLSSHYSIGGSFPVRQVNTGETAYLRDLRVLPLQVCPFIWDSASNTLTQYESIRVYVDLTYSTADGGPRSYTALSPAFNNLYAAQILNYADYRALITSPQNPRVLIIHGAYSDPTFTAKVAEFVTWKRQKGFEVSVASTAETGSNNIAIKSYIQAQYDDPDTRPDFIILLGDVSGSFAVPTFFETESGHNGEGDYPYTHLSGNDTLGDAFIGRISAEDVSQLITILNKVYTYEKNVNLNPSAAAWMNRMLIIGDPLYSGRSCVYTGQYIHEIAQHANPDYEFIENYSNGYVSTINSAINQGVGFFAYRGYYGVSGWSPSSSINNSFRLPHALVLTCRTGDFAATTLSEDFVRMGTGAVPAGAVTCIGMATGGTHTLFNNALISGITSGIFTHGMRTMGEALLNGKLYLHSTYANQPAYVRRFTHWCNLIGDPTLEAWVGVARELHISAPDSLPRGTATLEITVRDSAQNPLENISVTIYDPSRDAVVAKAFSAADGIAVLSLPTDVGSDLLITASSHNFKPKQQALHMNAAGCVTYHAVQVLNDDNSDGFANAGETVALQVELVNTTAVAKTGLSAVLSTDSPMVQITQANTAYPDMAPGASAVGAQAFVVSISPAIDPIQSIRFSLTVSDSDGSQDQSLFYLTAYNARLSVSSHVILDADNAVLDPGEDCGLRLTLSNSASLPLSAVYGELRSLSTMLIVADSLSLFGDIPAFGQINSVDAFQIHARDSLVPGMQIPFRLRLYNANGFEQICWFNLSVGTVAQNTPLGPDEYGYLIYDDTDTAYADCPVYDWVEIAPSLGGMGTLVPNLMDSGGGASEGDTNAAVVLKELPLPFTFRFYGIDYDLITVCVNGFIALGSTNNADYRNSHIPGGQGPAPMIAPFWDDLYIPGGAGIYQYYDAPGNRYIIQYHNLKSGFDKTSVESFQVIFYNPVFHHSGLGDGIIKIQYQTFNNVNTGGSGVGETPLHGNYCTVGIKDHSNTRGLEYTFNNTYPLAAAPLADGRALLITTVPTHQPNARLVLENMVIWDGNNGIPEAGESVELGIMIKNLGDAVAAGVSATLTSQSPYATVRSAHSDYPLIPGGGSIANRIPFTVSVADSCPNAARLNLLLEVSHAGITQSFPISLQAQRPEIDFSGFYINDSDANADGILEPGENAVFVVNIRNNAIVEVKNLSVNIDSSSPLLNLLDTNRLIGSIPPRSVTQAVFRFAVSADAGYNASANINVTYVADQTTPRSSQISVRIGSSGLYEDFENSNGGFISPPGGNSWQWGVSPVAGAHSGSKVWGTLLDQPYTANATWSLSSPFMYLGGNNILEFWHCYDSELGVDGGHVMISSNSGPWILLTPEDGYPVPNVSALGTPGWSGVSGWRRERIDLSAYSFTNVRLRWNFWSDAQVNGAGWFIDDVRTIGFTNSAGQVNGQILITGAAPEPSALWVANQAGIRVNPQADMSYRLYLPSGVHTLSASAAGYAAEPASDFQILPFGVPLQHDFLLTECKPVQNPSLSHTDAVLHLQWEAPLEPFFPINAYKVSRKLNAGAYECVAMPTDAAYSENLTIPGEYRYYVQTLYDGGESIPSQELGITYPFPEPPLPAVSKLYYNYPNPFNPNTTLSFDLAAPGRATLRIYNLRGQLVNTLCNADLPAGKHSFVWRGTDANNRRVASGVYLYRLSSPGYTHTRKMLLLK